MNIVLTYDPSVAAAPAAFKTALNDAVSFLDSTFSNPVTLNIGVGWGEVDGQSLNSSSLGESVEGIAPAFNYAQVKAALLANATSVTAAATAATLPANDPTGGATIDTGPAEAKALGLIPANDSAIDGWIGFSSTPDTFTFNPNARAVSGEFDFIGTALHEITEVMGRDADLGNGPFATSYSVLDLFRYSATGVRDLTDEGRFSNAYFSVTNGNFNLDNFNTDPSGDLGDWADSAGNDSFDAFSDSGVVNAFTSTDLAVMQSLGWTVSSSAASLNQPNVMNVVQELYQMALLRQGSANDVAAWTNVIDQNAITIGQLATDFATSPEAQNLVLPIVGLYQAVFDRAPDPVGLDDWVNALRGGTSLSAIAQDFVAAPEFLQHYGGSLTPSGYITALYENVLGRAPDAAGEQAWLAVLGSSPTVASEAAVAIGFSQSAEFLARSTGPIESWLSAAALSGAYGPSIQYPIVSDARIATSDHAESIGVVGVQDSISVAQYHAPIV